MATDEQETALIVGTYSGLNKGDRIMQQVTAEAIKKLGLAPKICCPFPSIDSEFYPKDWIEKSGRRNLIRSYSLILLLTLLPASMRSHFARRHKELRLFTTAKFVVDTSGDMLTEDYGPHVALSHLVPLIYCKLLDIDMVILAQSIGPFKRLGWLFDSVLTHAKVITARDAITYEYLKQRGLSNVEQAADLGFLLEPKPIPCSADSVNKSDETKCLVGICPSALFFRKFRKGNYAASVSAFAATLDTLARRHNAEFVFIPHVMTPARKMDDDTLSSELSGLLDSRSSILPTSLMPSEIKYLISKLDIVLTFRMHGAIAALDTLIPTLAISYSHKTDGLFAKLQIEEWVIQNDDDMLANLEAKFDNLLNSRVDVSAHLAKTVPRLRAEAAKNIEVLKALAT